MVNEFFYRESPPKDSGLEDRIISTSSWKHELKDLHAVMYIARMVHLAVQHGSEALVRVGVEIAACKVSKQCLHWHDYWYSDHEKREWFRKMVHDKLIMAIKNIKGTAYQEEEDSEQEESEEVKRLRQEAEEADQAIKAARHQQQVAELRCRECEQLTEEADSKVAELERAMERLKKLWADERDNAPSGTHASVQVNMAPLAPAAAPPVQEEPISHIPDQDDKEVQTDKEEPPPEAPPPPPVRQAPVRKAPKPKPAPVVEAAAEEPAPPEEEEEPPPPPAAAPAASPDPPASPSKKPERKPKAAPQARAPPPEPVGTGEEPRLRSELQAIADKLTRASRKLTELQEELQGSEARLAEAREQAAAAERRISELEARPPARQPEAPRRPREEPVPIPEPVREPPPPPAPTPKAEGGLSSEEAAELQELRKLKARFEKLQDKVAQREEELDTLREEYEELNAKHLKTLRVLANVREQLRKVKEIAERKGFTKQLNEMFGEAGLEKTLESAEVTCFSRLYQDALRRMGKPAGGADGQEGGYSFRRRGQAGAHGGRAGSPAFPPPALPPDGQAAEAGSWVWVPHGEQPAAAERPASAFSASAFSASASSASALAGGSGPWPASALSTGAPWPASAPLAERPASPLSAAALAGGGPWPLAVGAVLQRGGEGPPNPAERGGAASASRSLSRSTSQEPGGLSARLLEHSLTTTSLLRPAGLQQRPPGRPEGGAAAAPPPSPPRSLQGAVAELVGRGLGLSPGSPDAGAAAAQPRAPPPRSYSEPGLHLVSPLRTGGGLTGSKDSKMFPPFARYLPMDLMEAYASSVASHRVLPPCNSSSRSPTGVCKGWSRVAPLLWEAGSRRSCESSFSKSRRLVSSPTSNSEAAPAQESGARQATPSGPEQLRPGSANSLTPLGTPPRGRSAVTRAVRAR